ncbi:MAG: Hsp70 family protein [Myxococcales bacterium]|nr:Hsp70 family protein [Polyangiaceae bacterium]MDW8250132.1 Hsp70 family protein [Myxococcales bacterium]
MSTPRYVVGIDLGTTHTALAYLDLQSDPAYPPSPRVFAIPQLVARDTVESRDLLPSFLYLPHESEGPQGLPWDAQRTHVVGVYARSRGAEAPGRLVSSAKSWLCHPSIDRRSAVLPAGSMEVERVSPVEASFRYLEHLAEAWDHTFARGDQALALRHQEIVLTVPASFDAVARELTVEAAYAAGLENITLLEEPQAALYAWLDRAGNHWRKELHPGDLLLVVDIGGGTSDFSAIAVVNQEGSLGLERVAVGDHILLGGDNMDLALAYALRQRLKAEDKDLDSWQTSALIHACRTAKEQLFATPSLAEASVVIPGRGSKLLSGAIRIELKREDLERILVDGFFPWVSADARPVGRARAALTTLGLPYASDAAITRHLAAFLGRQGGATAGLHGFVASGPLRPTAVLFNGGVMKGEPLRERLLSVLQGWAREAGAPEPRALEGADLDLGVARGAAVYGFARRGRGIRIRGGTARSYYVGIESAAPAVPGIEPPISALCVAPFGMEEGTSVDLPARELGLIVGEPVRFRFFSSSVRREDPVGAELEDAPEHLEEMPPLEVTLPPEGRRAGDVVPVSLRASVTEIGTLLLEAVALHPSIPDERWKIEFNVRGEGG